MLACRSSVPPRELVGKLREGFLSSKRELEHVVPLAPEAVRLLHQARSTAAQQVSSQDRGW